ASDRQPELVTGGVLRDYQLVGLEWLISLYENGLNGVLGDEMGLGKTLQCISFLAHLIEKGVHGPFLICAPTSTVGNWAAEFSNYTPAVPVVIGITVFRYRFPYNNNNQQDYYCALF
ncbi:hypothetical protein Zmor_028492, partial [Zophobas morio]